MKLARIVAAAILITVMLAAAGCGDGSDNGSNGSGPPVPGGLSPDFTLRDMDGQTASLSDFRGRPVLLNFWATWCPPCRDEVPYLQGLAVDAAWSGRLEIVAVDIQESEADVRAFMQEFGMTYRVLLDTDGEVAARYNLLGIPTTFFIDEDGIIRYIKAGAFVSTREIEQVLESVIAAEQ